MQSNRAVLLRLIPNDLQGRDGGLKVTNQRGAQHGDRLGICHEALIKGRQTLRKVLDQWTVEGRCTDLILHLRDLGRQLWFRLRSGQLTAQLRLITTPHKGCSYEQQDE